jgi:hypothetical protein
VQPVAITAIAGEPHEDDVHLNRDHQFLQVDRWIV